MDKLSNTNLVDKEVKTCSKCGNTKDIKEFGYNSKAKDKLTSYCKTCQKVYRDSLKGNYIYLFIEYNGNHKEVVYIGSTNSLKRRLSAHLHLHSHIQNYVRRNEWDEIRYIEFDSLESREELYLIEEIFLEGLSPRYNQKDVYYEVEDHRLYEVCEEGYYTLEHWVELSQLYKKNYNKAK